MPLLTTRATIYLCTWNVRTRWDTGRALQITPGKGNRHEKNEQELDGTRKGGLGQSELENPGRRPMIHWE
ncbi:unnamed protein product [Schistosoma margrebowiei]|uniref:Uncharacterized protein n=1 Tax=Schistosoma margrebowiei TaxID=48269 RepID=A0A183LB33_9TREM|nr:unnamed protein product [Schistosoma margrebowiei]